MLKSPKTWICLCLIAGLLMGLTGCGPSGGGSAPQSAVYFTYFDTVSNIYSYAGDSQADFEANCAEVTQVLQHYHRLFDIYHEYSGMVNLATINQNAGGQALEVGPELIAFLLYARRMYNVSGGKMNVMLGSVLRLWHDCREEADRDPEGTRIPTEAELTQAAAHTDISALEIDAQRNTVRISDPAASLDVGALAKGYAAERAAEALEDAGVTGYVLDIGGNLRLVGTKPDGSGWTTGVKDPQDPETYAAKLVLSDTSCVTSGDYERYFTVDGVRYHHIIDPDTYMPATYSSSVTVIAPDSGLADALSTALFCMSYDEGLALVQGLGNVQVLWILADGTQYRTPDLPLAGN